MVTKGQPVHLSLTDVDDPTTERVCPICGTSLAGRSPLARFCSDAHRAEGWRIGQILSGNTANGHTNLASYEAARRRGGSR